MRAKFLITSVVQHRYTDDGPVIRETITMSAVTSKPYDPDGNSEDNTFSKWTPTGELRMDITNPSLFGQLKANDDYYLDFTKAS